VLRRFTGLGRLAHCPTDNLVQQGLNFEKNNVSYSVTVTVILFDMTMPSLGFDETKRHNWIVYRPGWLMSYCGLSSVMLFMLSPGSSMRSIECVWMCMGSADRAANWTLPIQTFWL
jgi:hypothetical protein